MTIESFPATKTKDCFSCLIGDYRQTRVRKRTDSVKRYLIECAIVTVSFSRLQRGTHPSWQLRFVLHFLAGHICLHGEAWAHRAIVLAWYRCWLPSRSLKITWKCSHWQCRFPLISLVLISLDVNFFSLRVLGLRVSENYYASWARLLELDTFLVDFVDF